MQKGRIIKDRGMILILYLKTMSDIGSPTQSSLQFKVFQNGRPFPASGYGRLLLLPWSFLATQNCTAVNQSPNTFGRQQGVGALPDVLPIKISFQLLTLTSFSSSICFIKNSRFKSLFLNVQKNMNFKVTFLKHLLEGSN